MKKKITQATWKRRLRKVVRTVDPMAAALAVIMVHAGIALRELQQGKDRQAEKTLLKGFREVRNAMRKR